ncbi:FAD-binding oxidoreductase [Legionella waltersii]|uniref:Cytokinin oxidase n=1 Tax=Legionella waltersii TaxID=66969 RepID=A0A0W1ANP5_9GAMM|nr:FAD-binding oxidoreductase [Legionella waltersii]KTD82880.1 cytokinin oxidase [Legionella waltersii]SNV02044.1 cytokinin oxidase [Legionella waltersii]
MPLNKWNIEKIKQYEKETGQALLRDEQSLVSFSQDFGKLIQSQPTAVSIPNDTQSLQRLIQFAQQQYLPITIRGNGLSQCGQSLPVAGGVTLSMQQFNQSLELAQDSIWVEANSSWMDLLDKSIKQLKAPYVLPYNCNLSVAGVLSAGGVGASSFKYGSINAHVEALEVIDGMGNQLVIDQRSPLFHACLSGQGRFAVITKACIRLRKVKPRIKTVCLVYSDQDQWFEDMLAVRELADYVELFCSPSIQGSKLIANKRVPMAQWLYGLHISVEFGKTAPSTRKIIGGLKPWNVIESFEEPVLSYYLRHNSRFDVMKLLGQWDLLHPWYECFVPTSVLRKNLRAILEILPIFYANLVHVVPVSKQKGGFLMLPHCESICSVMILNPGVPFPLKDHCLHAIAEMDNVLVQQGGKRYLSGFLGHDLSEDYWCKHFGEEINSWNELKKDYDPHGIFRSVLHPF